MEEKNKTFHRKKTVWAFVICLAVFVALTGRLVYLMVYQSAYYTQAAEELHQRERNIKAKRGRIIDATGTVLADNRTVCNISVIHNQIKDPDKVVEILARELDLEEDYVRKRVEKYTAIEKIKSNVDKAVGDAIRAYQLDGVKVDEDYKRYYPFDSLASKVLGFTGGDNQGIVGLEVKYDEYLQGEPGTILTVTDARGVEVTKEGEDRVEPVNGDDLHISLDVNIEQYATQLANQVLAAKEAESVSILVMKPDNGEILAMVNVPEFNLNEPFTLPEGTAAGLKNQNKGGCSGHQNGTYNNDSNQPRAGIPLAGRQKTRHQIVYMAAAGGRSRGFENEIILCRRNRQGYDTIFVDPILPDYRFQSVAVFFRDIMIDIHQFSRIGFSRLNRYLCEPRISVTVGKIQHAGLHVSNSLLYFFGSPIFS